MRSIGWLSMCLFLMLVSVWGCPSVEPGTENTPDGGSECSTDRECLKKRCPQTAKDEYDKCVKDRLESQSSSPEYVQCSAGACQDIAESEMGDGLVVVSFPAATTEKLAKDQIQWLRMYLFPSKDLDGKAITCDRLKTLTDADPAAPMSAELNRYFPPPDFDKPITAQVLQRGDTLDLPYVNLKPTVPAGSDHVLVVQGFCNPKEGSPTLATKAMWWACKENVETKAGKESTTINIELPIQNGDRCIK